MSVGYTHLNKNYYPNNFQSMSGGTVRSILPVIRKQKTKYQWNYLK